VSPSSAIPVVCALIERDGLVLVAQRPANKHLPLKWEFPGGKVEPGESPESAIVREIKEELGCDIVLVRALPTFDHDYVAVTIAMIPFVCCLTPASPEPQLNEHMALQWVKPEALSAIDLAAADLPVVASYL
jgi:8-oxo-dGTP diphosphatase